MISFKQKGDFSKLTRYLNKMSRIGKDNIFDRYGREGVKALADATPVDTGKTAASWSYEVIRQNGIIRLVWKNANIQNGVPIAVILQYGHAAKNGSWVEGRDYINPAIQPIFDQIAQEVWKEVIES